MLARITKFKTRFHIRTYEALKCVLDDNNIYFFLHVSFIYDTLIIQTRRSNAHLCFLTFDLIAVHLVR